MSNKEFYGLGRHLVRYSTAAEQKYLLGEFLSTYDQLVVNANMLGHMRAAISVFISQRAKKPFIIDPQTHVFQHDRANLESTSKLSFGKVKRSYQALCEAYGDPIKPKEGFQLRPVVPTDFAADKIGPFCARVLSFQWDSVAQQSDDSPGGKYLRFLSGRGTAATHLHPSLLIAPYFYLTPRTADDWIEVNIRCLDESLAFAKNKKVPLAAEIVLSKEFLQSESILTKITERYKRTLVPPAAFLIWLDGFSERDASKEELLGFTSLIKRLGEVAPVANLYGSYLSVVLGRLKLINNFKAVCHSLEHGENRDVVPIGGGIPVAKFYVPALHSRLKFRDAVRAVRAVGAFNTPNDFFAAICDCPECKKVIKTDPAVDFEDYGRTKPVVSVRKGFKVANEYPLPETKDHSVRHYMWCRDREYNSAKNLGEVIGDLKAAHRKLSRAVGLENSGHCEAWAHVLQSLP